MSEADRDAMLDELHLLRQTRAFIRKKIQSATRNLAAMEREDTELTNQIFILANEANA